MNHLAISLDYLCVSLSYDSTIVIIDDPINAGNVYKLGHFWMYELYSTKWKQLIADINDKSSDDWSEHSVSLPLNGANVIMGAKWDDKNGECWAISWFMNNTKHSVDCKWEMTLITTSHVVITLDSTLSSCSLMEPLWLFVQDRVAQIALIWGIYTISANIKSCNLTDNHITLNNSCTRQEQH